MFHSSFLNLSKRARMRNRFSMQARASDADSFSLKSPRKSPAKLPPGPNHSSLLTPNSLSSTTHYPLPTNNYHPGVPS